MPLFARQAAPSAGQSGSASHHGGSGASKSDDALLPSSFFWILIITAVLFAVPVIANLPRATARLASGRRGGELFQGMWFGNKGTRNSPVRQYAVGLQSSTPIRPKHFRAWDEMIPGCGYLRVEVPFTRGYTIGQLVTLVIYAALVGVAIGLNRWGD
jgi:hypothetical protein